MNEEFALAGVDGCKSLEYWGHHHPIILKSGRCSHFIPKELDEEASAAMTEELTTSDPAAERFADIS